MFEYGKYNFPKIIKKHPNYKNDLGHKMISSLWGYFLFNPCSRLKVRIWQRIFQHPLLTKFLVITHHRMTMARVDRLFGVSMPEKGISQLVSVDLEKAVQIKENE